MQSLPPEAIVIDLISDDELTSPTQNNADDSNLPQRVTNAWTTDQRIFLYYIRRRLQNNWEDNRDIFNQAFRPELSDRGFQKGLSVRPLRAQFHDGHLYQKDDFRRVRNTSFEDLPSRWPQIEGRVVDAARQQRITLLFREDDPWLGLYNGPAKKRNAKAHSQGTEDDSDVEPARPTKLRKHGDLLPSTPTPTRLNSKIPRALLQLPTPSTSGSSSSRTYTSTKAIDVFPAKTTRNIDDVLGGVASYGKPLLKKSRLIKDIIADYNVTGGVPSLLFRAFGRTSHGTNAITGFEAGLCDNTMHLSEDDEQFLQFAEDHLWSRPKPSPLISLSASFLSAIKKGSEIEKKSNEQDFIKRDNSIVITILDGRLVASESRLYHANPTVRALAIQKRLPRLYYARFEYWAWQKTQGVIGYASWTEFRRWASRDAYLGPMCQRHDLGQCSIKTFRQRCTESGLQVGDQLGHSIGSLVNVFGLGNALGLAHPVVKDFVETILQNFQIPADLDACLQDQDFRRGFGDGRQQDMKQLRTSHLLPRPSETRSDRLIQPVFEEDSPIPAAPGLTIARMQREFSTTSSTYRDLGRDDDMIMNSEGAICSNDESLENNTGAHRPGYIHLLEDEVSGTTSVNAQAQSPRRYPSVFAADSLDDDEGIVEDAEDEDGDGDEDEDEDEIEPSQYSDLEAKRLLQSFCRAGSPPSQSLPTNQKFSIPRHFPRSARSPWLRSPYESRSPLSRFAIAESDSGTKTALARSANETSVVESATTQATVALQAVVADARTPAIEVPERRKFTVITYADRQAAHGGTL